MKSNTFIKNEVNKYFLKYKKVCSQIFSKECELMTFKAKETSIGSPNFSEKVTSSKNNKGLEHIVIQIENIEESLEKLYNRKEKLRKKYLLDFQNLSNDYYKIILRSYYLDNDYIKDIAYNLNKSSSYIKKMKSEALIDLFNIVIKKTNND